MNQQIKKLLIGIQLDYKYYTQLVELLTEQRRLIIERHTDQLAEMNQKISEVYKQITLTTKERLTLLKSFNVPFHAEGMRAFFARLPEPYLTQATTLWNKLEQQAKTCQQLNERNAQLMTMQQDILNALLGIEPESIYQR